MAYSIAMVKFWTTFLDQFSRLRWKLTLSYFGVTIFALLMARADRNSRHLDLGRHRSPGIQGRDHPGSIHHPGVKL